MRTTATLSILLFSLSACTGDSESNAANILAEYDETTDAYCTCVGQTSRGDEMLCLEEIAFDTTVAEFECALAVDRQYGRILDQDCLIEGLQATRDCVAAAECNTLDDEYDSALDCAHEFRAGYDDCAMESRELSETEYAAYSDARSDCFE